MNPTIPILFILVLVLIWYYLSNRPLRLPAKERQVPDWAPFFNERKWVRFRELVKRYFQARGIEIVLNESAGVIRDMEGRAIGLQNVAQLCSQNAPFKWQGIVKTHFDLLLQSLDQENEIQKLVEHYEQVADKLAVRLWPESSLKSLPAGKIVYRKDIAGTITMLVYDFPAFVRNVQPDDIQKWGRPENELFDKALANVFENFKPTISRETLEKGVEIRVFSGQNFYNASHALLLERYPECSGSQGALVAVPNRQVMLCYPISSLAVVRVVDRLIPLVRSMEAQGPGSVSANLYWYHDRRFENLPYRVDGDVVKFLPPAGFVQMLNGLPEGEKK